jgi:dolichyl-phosphate beta-glucosyltransferase
MSYDAYQKWKTTPLVDEPELTIVIPTWNEAVRIVPTIGAIASHLCSSGRSWELIVADDGSQDDTVAIVEGLELVNARVLTTPRNGGKGSAVRRGMLAARGRRVLFADADNATPIEELDRLLARMDEGYDMVIGSRAVAGAVETHKSILRRLLSGGLRWLVRYVMRLDISDTQCGFKLYTREAAQRLHRVQTLMGFSFDLEILYLARKAGLRVAEVPVVWYDAPGSRVDARKEVQRFLKDMFRIRMTDWRGGYANV